MEIIFSNDAKCAEFLDKGLDIFNAAHAKPSENKPFGFYAVENGKTVGGVSGTLNVGYWTKVDLLYVDDKFRGRDIGTMLMDKVEEFARANACIGIHLSTQEWQAKGFYEKNGFSVFGILDNHPSAGLKRYYLQKQF